MRFFLIHCRIYVLVGAFSSLLYSAILFLAVGRRSFAIITNKAIEQTVDPIRHYMTRDELKFHLMLSIAQNSVEMLASTFTIMTEQYSDELLFVLNKGISFRFLLLDPNSKETIRQRGFLIEAKTSDTRLKIRSKYCVI